MPRARVVLSWAGICATAAWALASPVASGLPSRPPVSRIPKSIVVSTAGEHPNVLVDQIGTAHVVWNQSTAQGAPDVLHYCRIPRGATRCQNEQTFVPPETPPEGNKDFIGPRIVQTSADQIVILTHRYPSVVIADDPAGTPNQRCYEDNPQSLDACYASSNNSTWAYVTDDGGDSFRAPELLGIGRLTGPPIALTKGFDAPRIAMVSDTETGGTFFQALRTDQYSHVEANLGAEGRDRAYSGSVAAFGGAQPVVAFSDLAPTVYVRAYRNGPVNDSAGWAPSVAVGPGADPRLAGGPRGVYLLYKVRAQSGSRYVLKKVDPTGKTSSASTAVSEIGDVVNRDLFQDAGGTLHAAWVLRSGNDNQLHYRAWASSGSLGPTLTLAAGPASDLNNVDLSAADDGGGFAVWSSTMTGNGVIRAVPFGSQAPLIDVRVNGIEVTQAIQSFGLPSRDPTHPEAPVPYAGSLMEATGRTIVRVYANSFGPLDPKATPPVVTLRAFRKGKELGNGSASCCSILPEFSPATLARGAPTDVPMTAREDPSGAYTFTLPWIWTRGSMTFEAEINPTGLKPSIGECAACRADNRFTLSGVPFRDTTTAVILPISMTENGKRPAGFPDPGPIFAGLRATTPLHIDVQPYQAFYDVSYIENDPGLDRSEKSAEARDIVDDWAEDDNGELSSRFPMGIFPGSSKIGGSTNSEGELYGDDQPQSVFDDARSLTSVAHEFGHGIGLPHAGQDCPGTGPDDDQAGQFWPPDDKGLLDGIGLDRRVASPYRLVASGAPKQPGQIFDLMSYCTLGVEASAWTTIRNWNYAVQFRAPPQSSFRRRVARGRATASGAPASTLRVVGFVSNGRARIAGVSPDSEAPAAVQPGAPFVLVARDATGREIARSGVEVEREADGAALIRLAGRVGAAGVASVAFEQAGAPAPIATRARSANAPKVSLLAPRAGAPLGKTANVVVRWSATDADGDRLLATVDYSADGGKSFNPIAFGASGGSVTLPRRLFTASRNARVRVRVNDGFNETAIGSPKLTSLGGPPEVRIDGPRTGTLVAAGAAVALEGSAYDDAGRRIAGSQLRWLDGRTVLGRGAQVTATGLAPGRRTITLEARDARSRTGRRSIVVRVGAVKPLFTTLVAPKSVSKKATTVALRVAATVPSTLTAGGRRFAIGLRAVRLSVPVKAGRTPLTLPLVLTSGSKVTRVTLTVARR